MSRDSDRDLYARAQVGDWQARVALYKNFFHENSRVRRLGLHYSNPDDFLHDCFTNFLRASHTFQRASSFADRVEMVASWTAFERERLKELDFVRMCAAIEADEAGRARVATYAPPRSGPDDSLPSRISAIVGEPQFALLRARVDENATWEDVAAAAGKPLTTIGLMFVRSVDRLSRFFGAPPYLNADLEPVFAEVSSKDAAARHADPSKPRGRVISMQLDPSFYSVTPELRKIGLSVPTEVRTIALWDAARASAPPEDALRDHLAECRYCAEVLRALLLMQQAVRCAAGVDFLSCPGASTLLRDSDEAEEAFHQHIAGCPLCRDERTRALGGEAPGSTQEAGTAPTEPQLGRRIAWAVAAMIVLCGIPMVLGIRHFAAPKAVVAVSNETVVPDVTNTRYADLAQSILFDDKALFASALPRDQFLLMDAINDIKNRNRIKGKMTAERLSNQFNDPGAQTLYAECLYAEGDLRNGYREMQKAEAMPPRNSFRCWAALQCALMAGDKAVAEREIEHLSSDPDYGPRAKAVLAKLRARK